MRPLTPDDPRSVGPYRLLSRLGAGGMGRVYLGLDPSGTAAAVKVVRSEFAYDPGFRARFARELDLARRVSGAFTPRVLGGDTSGLRPWLAAEYVRGLPLRDLVERTGPLPESTARFLARGIGRALAHMHESGLAHRDLTPGNVMVSASGPQVIDFGISQGPRAEGGAEHTGDEEPTAAPGTPGYTAPEQLDGGGAGPPADVFALAAVLVYVLGGTGPFGDGHPSFLAYRVRALEPALTGVPADLRPLLAACLAKDPRERPTAARALAVLGGPPEPAVSAEAWLPPAAVAEVAAAERLYRDTVATASGGVERPRRRGRFLAVGAASAALLLVAGAGAWAALDRTADAPGPSAAPEDGAAGGDADAGGGPEGSEGAEGGTAAEPDGPDTSCDPTEQVAPEYAEAARDRLSVPGEETIGDDVYTVPSLSFSADGDALVVRHPEGVAVWDWREETETAYIGADLPDFAHTPVLSPDGCHIAYGSQGDGLHVFSVETGAYSVHAPDLPLAAVAFSPDGGSVTVSEGGAGSGVHTVDLATGEAATLSEDARTDILLFSPEGDRLLLSQDESLVVVDPADGSEIGRIGGVDFPGGALPAAWGDEEEGDLVYFGSGGVLHTNVLTGSEPRTLVPAEAPPQSYFGVALRSGSDRLYTSRVSYDDEGRFAAELDVWEYSTGERLSTGEEETRFAQDFVVHPDGEVVAVLAPGSGSVRILDPDDLSLLAELG